MNWSFGDAELRERIESWAGRELGARAAAGEQVMSESGNRRVIRLDDGTDPALLLKLHRVSTGPHALREGLKRTLGRSAALHELRALQRVHALGLPVPEPLGHARLDDGDELLVLRWVDGPLLRAHLADPAARSTHTLSALAKTLRTLHEHGLAHGDLHAGNVVVSDSGPVLLDWQCARACSGPGSATAVRDLALLDASLSRLRVAEEERIRVCRIALGLSQDDPDEAHRALRAVERASRGARLRHARNLARRSLRPGVGARVWRSPSGVGMRQGPFDEAMLERALAAHQRALAPKGQPSPSVRILKAEGRSRLTHAETAEYALVIKQVNRDGLRRTWTDGLRASPARRAWRAAAGLEALDIPCVRPIAWLDGPPRANGRSSLLLMEPLGQWTANDSALAQEVSPEALAEALLGLVMALHEGHVWHRDLKAGNVRLLRRDGAWVAAVLDLEDVRFCRRLSDARRIANLAQLNASLPEALLPSRQRERAFARYVEALPFRMGQRNARARIIAQSLRREHAWRGADCALDTQSPSG